MTNLKVTKIDSDAIWFDNGTSLYSDHCQDCCESHYLNFEDLTLEDFDGLEFDLTRDNFFGKIEGYGIELFPIAGHSVKVAGHGYNNGYYSTDLTLVIKETNGTTKYFDISECQYITD